MRSAHGLVLGVAAGVLAGLACGPVKEVGPTALVLEVYFSEPRGTKALLISGTAVVDGVAVNVFPSSQRPEQLTGAPFPVPQTVRILLNDSRGGQPLQLTVIGIDADGDAVEAATQSVVPVARQETLVSITLRPFTDTAEPDGGRPPSDAGLVFDAGVVDGGAGCQCPTGCCDATSRCAAPIPIPLGSGQPVALVLSGPVGMYCTGACPLGRTSQFVNGQCLCGATAPCGDGLRCGGQGAAGRCLCDRSSGCRGCCAGNTCELNRLAGCGNAGNACARCEGVTNVCQTTGRCSVNTCVPMPGQCCSGTGNVPVQWPACASANGDCVACDPLRSNTCRAVAVGGAGQPCGCGASGQCGVDQLCLMINNVPTCRQP